MITSEKIELISKALAAFQATVKPIKQDSMNPHYRSKYASLSAIMDEIREPLAKQGLSIVQSQNATRLLHSSGEWLEIEVNLAPAEGTPQQFGSAMTYSRRYGVSAILGLSTEEDDDGNEAQPPKQASVARPAQLPPSSSGPAGQPITPTNKIGFGKYAASSWLEVPAEYLTWLVANSKTKNVLDVATSELNRRKALTVEAEASNVDPNMGF